MSMQIMAQSFRNEICLPEYLYVLEGQPCDLFTQPILKRWRPYDDHVRFEAKGVTFARRLSTVATIDKAPDGAKVKISLVNSDDFETLQEEECTLRVAQAGRDTGLITAQILGDSYTNDGAFFRQVLTNASLVPNLQLVGLRKFTEGQFDEGRGGWRLANYFQIPKGELCSYHGYMQPQGNYRYWGDRVFWVMAWKVFRKTAPNTFEPKYFCGRYDACLERYDEGTGTLLKPLKGDLQYDSAQKTFLLFDGKKWIPKTESDFQWSFDYGKYLSMWNIHAPEFLFVQLGVNDFRSDYKADFAQWNEQIAEVQEAYLKAVPNGKFILCIPCSTMGTDDNAAGDFNTKLNAAMWRFRKNLIENFSHRESEGFYLLDAGIGVSNEFGYNPENNEAKTLPYAGYKGKERIAVQTGNPHPYANYATMGLPFAAFIQYYR